MGPFLGFMNGQPYLCCWKTGGYVMIDPNSMTRAKITPVLAEKLGTEAVAVCPSVPREGLSVFRLIWKSLASAKADLLLYLIVTILSVASIVMIPSVTSFLVTKIYPTRMLSSIMIITLMMVCIALSGAMFMLVVDRLQTRIQAKCQSRIMLSVWNHIFKCRDIAVLRRDHPQRLLTKLLHAERPDLRRWTDPYLWITGRQSAM